MPTKVCPKCSTLTETDKSFCPECGADYSSSSNVPASHSSTSGQNSSNSTVTIISLIGVLAGLFYYFIPVGTDYGYMSFGDRLRWVIGFPDLGRWSGAGDKAHYFFSAVPFWAALIVLIICLSSRSK